MHILLIEDDNETASYLIKGLKESGHVVDRASDGKEGLFMALDSNFDALIVDRMLPELDGLSLITKIREKNSDIPIIILSALGEVDERVQGLKHGADDYLAKPFSFSELLSVSLLFSNDCSDFIAVFSEYFAFFKFSCSFRILVKWSACWK